MAFLTNNRQEKIYIYIYAGSFKCLNVLSHLEVRSRKEVTYHSVTKNAISQSNEYVILGMLGHTSEHRGFMF